MKKNRLLFGLFAIFIHTTVMAKPPVQHSQNTDTAVSALTEKQSQQAQDWGLKAEEWLRFEALMQGPLGVYSPNLDPLTALGIEARSDAERRYYAELQVKAESRRVDKTLAYQRAYDEAFQRIYPNLLPIRSTEPANVTAKINDRIAVFVKENCPDCITKVNQMQHNGQSFDIYLVGSRGNNETVRRWAKQASIDVEKVKSRIITLNHDSGRWLSLGLGGELPAILKEVNGQWQRQ